jgi:hypothetical protein
MDTFSYSYFLLLAVMLRKIITDAYNRNMEIYALFVTLTISLITTLIWSLIMQFMYDKNCWLESESESFYHWINESVRLLYIMIAIYHLITLSLHHNESEKVNDDFTDAK